MNRCLLIIALVAGCEYRDKRPSELTPTAEAKSAAAPARAAAPATPVDPNAISGTVLETINASTYTYVRLDRGGSEVWIAGPQASLAVGAKLDKLQGQLMTDFHSNTLERTFDQIYFVNTFGASPAVAAPHPTAPAAEPAGEEVSGTVVQTMDAGGYTYAELDHAGAKTWVAGPTTKLAVGTKLGKMSGSLMTAFHSNTLNRTFDRIYFVGTYQIAN